MAAADPRGHWDVGVQQLQSRQCRAALWFSWPAVHIAPLSLLRGSGCAEKPLRIWSQLGSWGVVLGPPRADAVSELLLLRQPRWVLLSRRVSGGRYWERSPYQQPLGEVPARAPTRCTRTFLRKRGTRVGQSGGVCCLSQGQRNVAEAWAGVLCEGTPKPGPPEFSSGSSQNLVEIQVFGTQSVMV